MALAKSRNGGSGWRIEAGESGVYRVDFWGARRPEMWVLLTADWHWDNPKCRLDCIERDLKLAKQIGAMVISCGDHFCAMQGKYDKRSSKDSIRPEHQTGSYLDALVDTAADFLKPYAEVMGLISVGNHESSIYNRHETCLVSRLVERLRVNGSQCRKGSYNGWVQFCSETDGRNQGETYRLYYHHGSGGDAPVTQGTISMSRVSQFVDADCILSGHIHTKNLGVMAREKLSPRGIRRVYETSLVRCSTYKDEYSPLDGWHIEKGKGPRPTRSPAYWMRLRLTKENTISATFHDEPTVVQ
jgi:hypothetical protein